MKLIVKYINVRHNMRKSRGGKNPHFNLRQGISAPISLNQQFTFSLQTQTTDKVNHLTLLNW